MTQANRSKATAKKPPKKASAKKASAKRAVKTSGSKTAPQEKSTDKPKAQAVNGKAKEAAVQRTGTHADNASPEGVLAVPHLFGEMVSVLCQSKIHQNLKIKDLEWLLMPALVLGQARIFRTGDRAIGLALWAWLDDEGAKELNEKGRLSANNWRKGTDVMDILKARLADEAKTPNKPQGDLWLVDFVCPYATEENKMLQACMHDLMTGPLQGQTLNMLKTDAKTGERSKIQVKG